ncbi:MAG: carbohydrate ABC transporter permease [Spirochaetaceae bacterium]|jgi:N-acetylglucosamine transport system permease protein|nr:carbohydrate ABC transporter permease [Spirochaetaceae bacterium]
MKRQTRTIIGAWLIRILLIIFTFFLLYPVLWNIVSSFKTNTEFLTNQTALPKSLAWDNYVRAIQKASMGDYFLNSIFTVVFSTTLLLIFVVPASYCLARFRFPFSRLIEAFFMTCIFIHAAYIMVPLYVELFSLGLVDKLPALCLVYAVLNFPFSIFLLSGYMRSIPGSYFEAAKIDGCGNWGSLLRIMVPLAKSGIATVTMLSAMVFWNEYPLALVLIRSPAKRTLPVGIAYLYQVQKRATDFGALFAGLVIILIPTIIIYLIGQKYLLKGIGAGGVKE